MYVKRIVITGYRASELGIFQATDKKITIILNNSYFDFKLSETA